MTLSELLAAGTASFNAKRKRGELATDQSASTLTGLFFARADLSRLDLSNAELEDCTVSDVDFREANLSGAYLHGGRYERCDFRGAKLDGATLEHLEFVECDFSGATGLDTLEQEDVTGLGLGPAVEAPALEETPRFVPGHVAVNDVLERELEAHPDDEARWLVYADWLQAQGDLRGELITRQHRGTGFEDFVAEHADHLFGSCADELRGGGQIPELVVEWRHGFVVGATLQALNPERAVNLGDLVQRLLPLPACRFLRRVSFGLNHQVTQYGERQNDYAPVVNALIASPQLARLQRLEFGVQEPEIDEDSGEPEALHPWGDLSALWPHVPKLRALLVKGSGGVLGELVLPELREVAFQLDAEEQEVFNEIVAGTWPKLERFELWDFGVELEPLLHVLASLPLTHLALPFSPQLGPLLQALVRSPLLKRLQVLDVHDAVLAGPTLDWLISHLAEFKHLKRLDLSGAVDPHEAHALAKQGDFIVLHRTELPPLVEDVHKFAPMNEDDLWDELNNPEPEEEDGEAPPPANADLDIPDEHGD